MQLSFLAEVAIANVVVVLSLAFLLSIYLTQLWRTTKLADQLGRMQVHRQLVHVVNDAVTDPRTVVQEQEEIMAHGQEVWLEAERRRLLQKINDDVLENCTVVQRQEELMALMQHHLTQIQALQLEVNRTIDRAQELEVHLTTDRTSLRELTMRLGDQVGMEHQT